MNVLSEGEKQYVEHVGERWKWQVLRFCRRRVGWKFIRERDWEDYWQATLTALCEEIALGRWDIEEEEVNDSVRVCWLALNQFGCDRQESRLKREEVGEFFWVEGCPSGSQVIESERTSQLGEGLAEAMGALTDGKRQYIQAVIELVESGELLWDEVHKGLYAKIAQRLDGEATARSERGVGTMFRRARKQLWKELASRGYVSGDVPEIVRR